MKISIVTISYNQAEYIGQTLMSVLDQSVPALEYIVIDAGSTDGSREIINSRKGEISKIIFESDKGAADGLNKGFKAATGDIFGYLNSDDILLPGALAEVYEFFSRNPGIDVVYGDGLVIDNTGQQLRRCFSDKFSVKRVAYGASITIQPSTFFRRHAYFNAGGFNLENKSSWDGELLVDMALTGAKFKRVKRIWSGYRIHSGSITGSSRLALEQGKYQTRIFTKIMGRERNSMDEINRWMFWLLKHMRQPRALVERILKGPIYGRFKK